MKKKETGSREKTSTAYQVILTIGIILCLLASAYAIYNILLLGPIEPLIRYIIVAILIIIDLLFIIFEIKRIKKKRKKKRISVLVLMAFYIIINALIGMLINTVYSPLNNINKDYITYTTVIITNKDNEINSISDLKKKKIGIITKTDSIEGYEISQDIIKENKLSESNELVNFDDYTSMINALAEEEIDAMFIAKEYKTMFQNMEGYVAITDNTKVIYEKSEKKKKKDSNENLLGTNNKALTEPFTILLMGVDSEVDGLDKNTVANGDSLMLITFNPKTLNATILSIPRDSYVPIACFKNNIENKITHAAWYGESCMMQTIEDLTDVKIDYYVKINFQGVVGLVNALGGIDVDVPQDLCTDSSHRGGQICIKKGWQHLDGEGALVLARNRKSLENGDLDRGKNQQLVVQALLRKATNISNITKVSEILNTVSHNMDTNFSTEQILSFYNIGKEILARSSNTNGDVINMQQLYLQGTGQMIYDEGSRLVLWDYILTKQSVEDVSNEMKLNLGLSDAKMIKTFSFSINDDYTKTVIGEGPYDKVNTYALLPDFTGDTKAQAQSWANKNGITLKFTGGNGTVIDQDTPAKKRLDKISGAVTLTLSGGNSSSTNDEIDCSLEENATSSSCKVPDFTKMTRQEINTWVKPLKNVTITFNEVSQATYPSATVGQIVSQDIKAGTYLKDTKKIVLGIIVKDTSEKEEETPKTDDNKSEPTE